VVSASATRRAVLASIIGNGLEWFDFLVYGFFTGIISSVFFPTSDPFVSTLLATATFSIAFFLRPLGGVLLSIYSDKFGRKPVLSFMILMMGFATVAIGLTPSYASIGIAAPLMIILARIMQGLSVGGEFASATAMLTEYSPPGRKMFFGSFQMCSQAFALALAGFAGYVLSTSLTPEALSDWGWRIPFILGALIGPVGFYIRRFVEESPEFARIESSRAVAKTPLREVLRTQLASIVNSFGVIVAGTVSNYVWFVFLPGYVVKQLKLPFTSVFLSSLACGLALFVLCPVAGHLADRLGAKRLFTVSAIAFAALAYPMLSFIVAAPSFERLLIVQLLCTIPIAGIWGPTPGFIAGMFPTNVRSTGMSISYNLAVLLFGGLAPFTLTWLIGMTGSNLVPAYYIIACTVISMAALWLPRPRSAN